jgi:hypothetical protein
MKTYVTIEELKTYMGLSGSSHDARLEMINKQATDIVNGILNASDLTLHKVTDEIHDGVGNTLIRLSEPHTIAIGSIFERVNSEDIEYTQTEPYDISDSDLRITGYLTAGPRKVKITYAAGWNLGGSATAEIVDYSLLSAKTFTITLGKTISVLTEGSEWNAGASNESAATSLSAAINAVKGVNSFVLGTTVYIIDETPNRATTTIDTNAGAAITLSSSTLDNVNFPEAIKGAIMIYVSDMFTRAKNSRVKSYTIGSKQVTFASDSEAKLFTSMLDQYKRALILII